MVSPIQQAALLVGGRGTRLGALTESIPKPLAPVAGRPFLDWQIREVARHGFTRITLLAGYRAEQIVDRYHGRRILGARIEVLVEPAPLGTAGCLRLFRASLDDRFLLLNGDTLFSINLLDLPLHAGEALGTLALRSTAPGGRYGTVDLREDGGVTGFLPRAPGRNGPINGGIYVLERSIVDWIGEGPVSLEAEVFPRLAQAGKLRGALYDGEFIDIGIPEDLERAQNLIPEMQRRPAAFLDRDGVLIVDDGYPHDPAKVTWTPGAAAALKRLNDAGYYVFVVTNQAGVGRGYYPEPQVEVLHRWMAEAFAAHGAHVDAWEHCPHHPEAGLEAYRRDCRRRKPRPGMIEDLLAVWPVRSEESFLIGDRETDLAAAAAAGIAAHRFTGGALDEFLARTQVLPPGRPASQAMDSSVSRNARPAIHG
jgi:D-glycero-D-manno-heptose 1,7-bisphosphate phosphatase